MYHSHPAAGIKSEWYIADGISMFGVDTIKHQPCYDLPMKLLCFMAYSLYSQDTGVLLVVSFYFLKTTFW